MIPGRFASYYPWWIRMLFAKPDELKTGEGFVKPNKLPYVVIKPLKLRPQNPPRRQVQRHL